MPTVHVPLAKVIAKLDLLIDSHFSAASASLHEHDLIPTFKLDLAEALIFRALQSGVDGIGGSHECITSILPGGLLRIARIDELLADVVTVHTPD
jgi:hypothetical protein